MAQAQQLPPSGRPPEAGLSIPPGGRPVETVDTGMDLKLKVQQGLINCLWRYYGVTFQYIVYTNY